MINICIFVVQTSYLVFKMLKTLLKQVKQYKTASFLTPVFIMLEVVLDVLIPFVTAKLIDNGISAGHMPSVYKYGLIGVPEHDGSDYGGQICLLRIIGLCV